jgi:hypothetical protein
MQPKPTTLSQSSGLAFCCANPFWCIHPSNILRVRAFGSAGMCCPLAWPTKNSLSLMAMATNANKRVCHQIKTDGANEILRGCNLFVCIDHHHSVSLSFASRPHVSWEWRSDLACWTAGPLGIRSEERRRRACLFPSPAGPQTHEVDPVCVHTIFICHRTILCVAAEIHVLPHSFIDHPTVLCVAAQFLFVICSAG